VQSFIALDPYWTLADGFGAALDAVQHGALAGTRRDYLRARRAVRRHPPRLFQHGVEAVGIPTPAAVAVRASSPTARDGATLGADLDEFPLDFAHYGRYHRELKALPYRYPLPPPLTMADLDRFLAQAPDYPEITVEDVDP
jgi:hypothetical protein